MIKMTCDQYKAILSTNLTQSVKKTKYRAVPASVDGIRFHSKKEAEYYSFLKTSKLQGIVKLFLMQVPFHLPGKIKYLLDFLVFYNDGRILFIDVKGRDTPVSLMKRKQVEEIYGIEVKLV